VNALIALAERVEAASADEQATLLIEAFDLIDWRSKPGAAGSVRYNPRWFKFDKMIRAEAYESAAMMLVPEGMGYGVADPKNGVRPSGLIFDGQGLAIERRAATPSLALTAAALRARAAGEG
jgi:hypothetical protein